MGPITIIHSGPSSSSATLSNAKSCLRCTAPFSPGESFTSPTEKAAKCACLTLIFVALIRGKCALRHYLAQAMAHYAYRRLRCSRPILRISELTRQRQQWGGNNNAAHQVTRSNRLHLSRHSLLKRGYR
jgi:hypothetical protein